MSDQPLQNNRRPAPDHGEGRHQPSSSHHVDESARGRQKYSFTPSASTRVSKKWDYSSMRGSSGDESKLVIKEDRRRSQTPSTPTATRREERTRQHNRARGRRSSATKVTAPAPKDEGIRGIPLWAVPLLLIATLLTGAVISMSGGTLGWIYLVCFGLISLCIALFVEPRGIFLAVAQIPLVFSVVTPFAGWLVAQTHSDNNFSATVLIGSAYPLFQQFPYLLVITLGAAAIGYLRLAQLRRAMRGEIRQREEAARRQRTSDEKNRKVAQRARRISTSTSAPRSKGRSRAAGQRGSVTVQDLLRRQQSDNSTQRSSTPSGRRNRSVDDDLYQ